MQSCRASAGVGSCEVWVFDVESCRVLIQILGLQMHMFWERVLLMEGPGANVYAIVDLVVSSCFILWFVWNLLCLLGRRCHFWEYPD